MRGEFTRAELVIVLSRCTQWICAALFLFCVVHQMDKPPKNYKPPVVNDSPECTAAWNELIKEQGYPMTCVEKVCRGYFSAGWEAAQKQKVQRVKEPLPMPKG